MTIAMPRWIRETRTALRLTLLTGAVLAASATGSAYLGARHEDGARVARIESEAGRLADVAAALGAQALARSRPAELESIADALARDPRVRSIELRDRAGAVLVGRGPVRARDEVIASREARLDGDPVGSVAIGLSTDPGHLVVNPAWQRLALELAIGLLLLFAAVSLFVRRTMSRPLAAIASAMQEMADTGGSLARRIEAAGPEELAAVGRQFNRMAERLRASHEDLARRVAETAAKNAELDSFVYSVAHDLKAPLLTIRGFCELLREHAGPQLDAADLRCLDRLDANVERLERLIYDLLTFARIGRDKPSPEHVDVTEMIDDLQLDMRGLIRDRGVKVTVDGAGVLWGPRSQIEQVFRNLLSNAIKYAGDTPTPTVEIGMSSHDEMWECYVRDNGIGIDPAYHEKIFEIFQRLKDVEVEGTGVGLAIVKKVVERAGGRIWVDSAVGQGSTFYFTWPRAEATDPALAPATSGA